MIFLSTSLLSKKKKNKTEQKKKTGFSVRNFYAKGDRHIFYLQISVANLLTQWNFLGGRNVVCSNETALVRSLDNIRI